MSGRSKAKFRYYGISPFEIEVIYDILKESFELQEEQLASSDSYFMSIVEIEFPAMYDESFFNWFSAERWFRIKEVLKEMVKRRGRKDIKIVFDFCGSDYDSPKKIRFTLKGKNSREFELAIEKIEYMVDILNMQLRTFSQPLDEIEYLYNEINHRWYPSIAKTGNESKG